MDQTAISGFRKLGFATLIAVYFLILIGGIVRTTGSGMGCPDWPKCFGRWTPPSDVSQLPGNYKVKYAEAREKKNLKFVRYLRIFGFNETADQITSDKAILNETDFNFVKSWIEYGNRIVGVIIGFLIVALFWRSLKFRKSHTSIFLISLATLIAVIIQGWFGSIVVSTNLTSWTITVHMFLALLIVGFLVFLVSREEIFVLSQNTSRRQVRSLQLLIGASVVTLLVQILFGTEVRAAIDRIAGIIPERSEWVQRLGIAFTIHRSFSLLILALNALVLLKLAKTMRSKALPLGLLILILSTLLTGIGMAYFGVPAVLQPLHLVLATSAFGVLLFVYFALSNLRKTLVKD